MNKIFSLTCAVTGILILSACHHSNNDNSTDPQPTAQVSSPQLGTTVPDPAHTAENSLDWNGAYQGVLPCADCPGIKTVLILNLDKTYSLEETYLERQVKPFVAKGTFQFDKTNSSLIVLDGAADNRIFFIGEGFAEARALDGSAINGPMKAHYQLRKIN